MPPEEVPSLPPSELHSTDEMHDGHCARHRVPHPGHTHDVHDGHCARPSVPHLGHTHDVHDGHYARRCVPLQGHTHDVHDGHCARCGDPHPRHTQLEIHTNSDQETNEDVATESDHPYVCTSCVKAIKNKITDSDQPSKGRIIHRVPNTIGDLCREAYVPRVVSIGPCHYSDCRLQDTKKHKWRYLGLFLKRTNSSVKKCLKRVSKLKSKAQTYYSDFSPEGDMVPTKEFVEMMLVDACFVIELFRVSSGRYVSLDNSKPDPIFSSCRLVADIQRDLLLLENQLPFFVLDKLFSATRCKQDTATLVELALQFFNCAVPVDTDASNIKVDPLHLLHLVQQALLPSEKPRRSNQTSDQPHPSVLPVTVLRECGVKFQKEIQDCCFLTCCLRKRVEKFDKLLDIEFDKGKGVLKIPPSMIHDSTKHIFLNLLAFEQCHPRFGNHVTSYLLFMDRLINSSQDVSHLCRKEIIDNYLGNEDDVAKLFNSLCQEIVIDFNASYLEEVARDVNQYAQKKRHGWMATLMHEYLRNPWAITALLVATVILLFTATQTFFTVFPYYVPSSH